MGQEFKPASREKHLLRGVSILRGGSRSPAGSRSHSYHSLPVSQYGDGAAAALSMRCMSPRKKSAGKNKTDEVFIPDKLYFRIGEVATLCRLPAYVLRFWESEFPQLKPVKSGTGQRMYRRRDVETVLHIKQLLYEQGFTIVGARQQLRSETKTEKGQSAIPFPSQSPAEIQHIRQGLREILNLLSARRTG
jgi:DNA-binding transcriptional MerR regulator